MARFYGKKRYGQSKQSDCPFCGKVATQMNKDGVLVCRLHLHEKLEEIKCTCGSWLEQLSGKFGPYFNCLNCGNINFQKGMEIKAITMTKKSNVKENTSSSSSNISKKTNSSRSYSNSYSSYKNSNNKEKKEITITSDDVEYFS